MCEKWKRCLWVTKGKCKHPHPQKDLSCYDATRSIVDLMKHKVAWIQKRGNKN